MFLRREETPRRRGWEGDVVCGRKAVRGSSGEWGGGFVRKVIRAGYCLLC